MSRKIRSEDDVRRVRRLVAFLGILLALIGQVLTFAASTYTDRFVPSGLWLSLVGVLVFVLSQFVKPAPIVRAMAARLPSESVAWILAALVLSGLATLAAITFEMHGRLNYIPATTFWLGSGLCYVMAFRSRAALHVDWRSWFKAHQSELFWLGAITLLGAALRFYELGSSPRIIDGDEGLVGLSALATVAGRLSNPFALWANFGAAYLQAINLAMGLFGVDPFGLRFLPAVGGTLAIPALYLFARQVSGTRPALIAAAILAMLHAHLHFSRIASVAYIQGTWLAPLELYFLLSGLEKRSSWRAATAGVLLAINFSVYLTAQVMAGLVLVYMLLSLLFLRTWFKPALRQAAAFWGGLIIAAMPLAVYGLRHPAEFLDRLNQDGTFQSGWLAQRMGETGESAIQILAERVGHAFLSLLYFPPIDFYGSPVPVLSLISAALFLLGIGISLRRTAEPGALLLNGFLWAPTLAVGLFALPPSADSYRMLMALPAAVVMAAIALDEALSLLGLGWNDSRKAYTAATGAVLLSLLAFNTWTYYADFLGRCRFGGNLSDRFASYLGIYVRDVSSGSRIYLLSDDTYHYGTHASVDFLSGRRPIVNYPDPVDSLEAVSGETIIANPARVQELEAWAHSHPGGELDHMHDCTTTILLAYQYP